MTKQGLREEFRTVLVRKRSGRWWRRWRWAVEEKRYSDVWCLKDEGYAFTQAQALQRASVNAKPYWAKLARIESVTYVEHECVAERSTRPSPLPPLLTSQPPASTEGSK